MSGRKPRIVIITQDGPEQRYVANVLCEAFDVAAVLVDRGVRPSTWCRLKRMPLRAIISKCARAAFLRLINDRVRRQRAIERVLGQKAKRFACGDLVMPVDGLRIDALERCVRAASPDIIAVYGCGIVPGSILNIARVTALNMHTGLSPWYRGTHCAFWPIVNGEPEMIGSTVHACTCEVDQGVIFDRVHPQLEADDGIHEVFARCVKSGSDAYVRAIGRVIAGSPGIEPERGGRTYRGFERGIVSELRARWKLRRGMIRKFAQARSRCQTDARIKGEKRDLSVAYDAA